MRSPRPSLPVRKAVRVSSTLTQDPTRRTLSGDSIGHYMKIWILLYGELGSGFITSAAVLAVGGALFGISYIDIGFTPRRWVDPVRITGVTLMAGGAAGMIATGALLGVRKRKLRELQAAHCENPPRVHWDLARSRLVF